MARLADHVISGAQSIMEGIAKLLGQSHIHLSSPVASIDDRGSYVAVKSTTGRTFHGRKCIISIPSTLLRTINIQPLLPRPVQDMADATKLGDYNKSIVCYDRPWWREQGYNGFFMSYQGYISVARDTSVDEKRLYCLTCFMNGEAGAEWSRVAPYLRRKVVLDQIADVFQQGLDSEVYRPIEIFEQVWKDELYSQGALVPIPALGHLTECAATYGKPVGNIHFVGTEYADEWKGYMEGALDSGERGAAEVVLALGPPRAQL
jgi:monoamine oxidase